MLREIVFDTETTGLDATKGDRLIELGCVEIVNRIPTGREFHQYINPERDVHPDAVAVHGLTATSCGTSRCSRTSPTPSSTSSATRRSSPTTPPSTSASSTPSSARLPKPPLPPTAWSTRWLLARRRHPAGPNSLDALCKRYGIDNSERTKHGALIDSLLLAGVYVELLGERQATLGLNGYGSGADARGQLRAAPARQRPAPLASRVTAEVEEAHREFVKTLGPDALWLRVRD